MNIEQLQRFCSRTPGSYYGSPWSAGDFTYATTGFVLVRVPRMADVPERPGSPTVENLITQTPMPSDGWVDLPGIENLALPQCPNCKGESRQAIPCRECDGEGELVFHSSAHEYRCDCQGCDGSGEMNFCVMCEGTGYLSPEPLITVAGREFKTRQLLGLVEAFGPIQIAPDAGPRACNWLRFEGGHALVMAIVHASGG